MTEPFLPALKHQLLEGRARLRRRRRAGAVAMAGLVAVGVVGGVTASSGRGSDPVELATAGTTSAPMATAASTTSERTSTQPPNTTVPRLLDDIQQAQAEGAVRGFLAAVIDGADQRAAGHLSPYAVATGGAGGPLESVAAFRAAHPWLSEDAALDVTVTPAFSFGDPKPVVTVVDRSDDGAVEHAIAFVVERDDDGDAMTLPRILRLPEPVILSSPASGSAVSPGQTVTISGVPLEGGATAFVGDTPLAVDVDLTAGRTTVTVPELNGRDLVLTVSYASPEEPGAWALWFTLEAN